ncbi:hypothetical protein C8N35_1125 [Breoghania corrubedonensis]|uniref:Cyanovirin-N domain-containing protein n=1 Tax=Breoghania corrubedonensis TaxID=665038 RepID=A0A2T5UW18_9HYPH|nr:hypothetical protein [Breoghania corrubedonensis]PTW55682.1 hypothetical protein C8N35_1125 [Breoghania corrubedonensis]
MRDYPKRCGRGPIGAMGLCLTLSTAQALAGTAAIENGLYDAYSCAAEESDQRVELRDGAASFHGYECRLSNPRALDGFEGAVLFAADCDGEGGKWSENTVLMQTRDGGIALLTSSWGDHYERCK